ncbi:thioesterase II family protein [Nocardia noduli]|uniref:thioesterase II family protein n=1 Tax=Nocardia noduli TaxID=2815722 RepID=UPI0027DEF7BB|nr:alpha/beta fold hydrolase [Nocardia noduli]
MCFPHAGGSASFFLPLSRAMPPEVEVLSVQYPGRQDRRNESPAGSIAALADSIADNMRFSDKPLALFGHSMGAILAYEVTKRLSITKSPIALFVSGRRAPSRYRLEIAHTLSDEKLLEELKTLGGTDSRAFADNDIVRMILPVVRADYRAIETYFHEPGTEVSIPISAHIGDRDPRVTVDEASSWKRHTSSSFELHIHTGGHFYLTKHVDSIITHIQQKLSEHTYPPG